MAEQPHIAVVVPTRNRASYLGVTLASLALQELDHPYEVVVVDDGSTDDTAGTAAAAGVRTLRHDRPQGPNAARNTGIRATAAELIALVDDDVFAPPGWLHALLEGARAHPDADVLGGPIEARFDGRPPRSCGREAPPVTTLDLGPDDREAEFVWSANMLLRREAFDRLDGFSAEIPIYGDEEDFLRRLRAGGGRVMYVAGARLFHRRSGRDARLRSLVRAEYSRGRNLRAHDVRLGKQPSLAGELRTLGGCGWHTMRRACPQGLVMGAHSAGRTVEAVRRSGGGTRAGEEAL